MCRSTYEWLTKCTQVQLCFLQTFCKNTNGHFLIVTHKAYCVPFLVKNYPYKYTYNNQNKNFFFFTFYLKRLLDAFPCLSTKVDV